MQLFQSHIFRILSAFLHICGLLLRRLRQRRRRTNNLVPDGLCRLHLSSSAASYRIAFIFKRFNKLFFCILIRFIILAHTKMKIAQSGIRFLHAVDFRLNFFIPLVLIFLGIEFGLWLLRAGIQFNRVRNIHILSGCRQISASGLALVCHAVHRTNAVVHRMQAILFRLICRIVPAHRVRIQRINRGLTLFLFLVRFSTDACATIFCSGGFLRIPRSSRQLTPKRITQRTIHLRVRRHLISCIDRAVCICRSASPCTSIV